MDFFNNSIDVLQTIVMALGAGFVVWGFITIGMGNGDDGGNPAEKSRGMKMIIGGGIIAFVGLVLVPQMTSLFGK